MNHNLYAALRAQFPSQLDSIAVETDDGLSYSWRDLERASAMLANLLEGLNIPKGARVAVPNRPWWCVAAPTLVGLAKSPSNRVPIMFLP